MNPAIPRTEARPGPGPEDATPPAASSRFDWRSIRPVDAAAVAAVSAALAWSYAPNIARLYKIWSTEPDYSHGFLVLPLALVILWRRWPAREVARPTPWWPAWALVIATLAFRYYVNEKGMTWMEAATMLPTIIALGLAGLGWRMMLRVWPAFAFLLFLLPLPNSMNSMLSQPLQRLATTCSCELLKLSGLWVMPEGNVILVGQEKLEVAAACNGLSMLMSLAATVAATASILAMATWKRMLLLASIIPVALLSNVIRIAATAWCYYEFGADVGSKYAHDAAGWLMMPLAMALVGLELALMSWLIVESTEGDRSNELLDINRVGHQAWEPGTRA